MKLGIRYNICVVSLFEEKPEIIDITRKAKFKAKMPRDNNFIFVRIFSSLRIKERKILTARTIFKTVTSRYIRVAMVKAEVYNCRLNREIN